MQNNKPGNWSKELSIWKNQDQLAIKRKKHQRKQQTKKQNTNKPEKRASFSSKRKSTNLRMKEARKKGLQRRVSLFWKSFSPS